MSMFERWFNVYWSDYSQSNVLGCAWEHEIASRFATSVTHGKPIYRIHAKLKQPTISISDDILKAYRDENS